MEPCAFKVDHGRFGFGPARASPVSPYRLITRRDSRRCAQSAKAVEGPSSQCAREKQKYATPVLRPAMVLAINRGQQSLILLADDARRAHPLAKLNE